MHNLAKHVMNAVALPWNQRVPALGGGASDMGETKAVRAEEIAMLRPGMDPGVTFVGYGADAVDAKGEYIVRLGRRLLVLTGDGELLAPRDGTHLKNRFGEASVGIDAHFRRWPPVRFSAGADAGWNERVCGPHAEPRDSPQPRRI